MMKKSWHRIFVVVAIVVVAGLSWGLWDHTSESRTDTGMASFVSETTDHVSAMATLLTQASLAANQYAAGTIELDEFQTTAARLADRFEGYLDEFNRLPFAYGLTPQNLVASGQIAHEIWLRADTWAVGAEQIMTAVRRFSITGDIGQLKDPSFTPLPGQRAGLEVRTSVLTEQSGVARTVQSSMDDYLLLLRRYQQGRKQD